MITSYKDLKIGKYLEILDVCKQGGDELDTQVKMLSVLSGLEEAEILSKTLDEYVKLVQGAAFLNKAPELPKRPDKSYKVGRWVLVPVRDVTKITAAQYIDFQTLAKKENSVVEVLSCLLVPEGMKYGDGYDIADVQADIRECMNVADAMGAYAFFLRSSRRLTRDSLYCSALQTAAKKMPVRDKIRFVKKMMKAARLVGNGVG